MFLGCGAVRHGWDFAGQSITLQDKVCRPRTIVRMESKIACLWVGWASRLPDFASRGILPARETGGIGRSNSRSAARDARHGRRDAHPTLRHAAQLVPRLVFWTRMSRVRVRMPLRKEMIFYESRSSSRGKICGACSFPRMKLSSASAARSGISFFGGWACACCAKRRA